ncbi:RING/U-box superfamily protein [Striga hermonthica]|uniref:RING-type E3 ubiquitin transferase n=1 Tax=Striga hermonthica TaxID=68872 RepID=A0A9N7N391_STRHE|nr:RING/U-box superfamily protein [Striga hermonthica]
MGSRFGYEYRYGFELVDLEQINSKHKSKILNGRWSTPFLFEIRTKFVVVKKKKEVEERVIDSEKFDSYMGETECSVALMARTFVRLNEYWMSGPEIRAFASEADAFARDMARTRGPGIVPVAVNFQVRTVQAPGEPDRAVMKRAICGRRLVPLYLWDLPTVEGPKKPLDEHVRHVLFDLPRTRIERMEEGWHFIFMCDLCMDRLYVGAQVTKLPNCGHRYHSHCLVKWLEDNCVCPCCRHMVYFTWKKAPGVA